MTSTALERPVQTIGELAARIDNLIGENKRLAAKLDDFRLLLVEAKDQVSPLLRDRIRAALALPPIDRNALLVAQRELCERNGWPHFAPYTGICRCGADIVDESWAGCHITGCRKCGRSYCD